VGREADRPRLRKCTWIARATPPGVSGGPGTPGLGGFALFLFFSNRLGCLGSIVVSVILTAVLVLLLRSCSY
jgi:hypothetical protein